jgi:hypothetical protein
MRIPRRLAVPVLAAVVPLLSGCYISVKEYSVEGSSSSVSGDEMRTLIEANKGLRLGMSRDDALSRYPAGTQTLLSSATMDGRRIEEWRVQATSRRRHSDPYMSFRRYLYFADDRLVEFGDSRVDYQANPARAREW